MFTPRAFSNSGLNGLTADQRFDFLMRNVLGYSSSQIDRLLAGERVVDVGMPASSVASSWPTAGELDAALRYLQGREGTARTPFDAGVNRAADAVRDAVVGGLERQGESELADVELAMAEAEAIERGVDWLTSEAGEYGVRLTSELEELRHLNRTEAFERINQAILGGFTAPSVSPWTLVEAGASGPAAFFDWERALDGLAGNETYRGSDHFLLQRLPERYREPLGSLLEKTLTVAVVGGAVAGAVAGPVLPVALAAAVGAGVGVILADLEREDSQIAALLEAVLDDAQRLIEMSGLDDWEIEDIQMQVESLLRS